MSDVIPDDVAAFVTERISSVAELEGLLILRHDAQTKWRARDLASRLYIKEKEADELLRSLCEIGLAARDGGEQPLYCYRPASEELEVAVSRVAKFYATHLVPVTELIHSRPRQRVQGFADAFKFRKDG
jgi:hypothetical protein